MRKFSSVFLYSFVLVCLFLAGLPALRVPAAYAAERLPALGADASRVSVSGLSSGAFMALQYGIAFSRSIIGVGVVAGGPYGCAQLSGTNFMSVCMSAQPAPNGETSYDLAAATAEDHDIDAVKNIAAQKIYLFSGVKDTVVKPQVMDAVKDFYLAAQVAPDNLTYMQTLQAGHAFVTDDQTFGNACNLTRSPFIVHCETKDGPYDQPEAILSRIYGPLNSKATQLSSQAAPFDQTEFSALAGYWSYVFPDGLAKTGYVYVPEACRQTSQGKCAVHVVFHGCQQSAEKVGADVYARLGYNEWADTNRIIVLYPQISASNFWPANPNGCWDWWGYTGTGYYTQRGVQAKAIKAMIDRLEQ
ncbi:extracellular catalytic domain type 2 short-chain-length polyhydroxyalkanoate depolymerase [Beijerinckia mobilis]|uniref:extracellular catalytic domain type 2 short-chain-length polyhydroxyalkanoate depolymerase n=1 Tax=Beijerinckia mobilis TaxID=231434 RepID=UPI00054E7F2C|nr:hypothetical protein [Beijerinckia mobilis]